MKMNNANRLKIKITSTKIVNLEMFTQVRDYFMLYLNDYSRRKKITFHKKVLYFVFKIYICYVRIVGYTSESNSL